MLVEEAFKPSEQALNLRQHVLDLEQKQLINASKPLYPGFDIVNYGKYA